MTLISFPEFPTSSLIVAVSVVLVVLLIALLFAVARQRKKKTQGSAIHNTQTHKLKKNKTLIYYKTVEMQNI